MRNSKKSLEVIGTSQEDAPKILPYYLDCFACKQTRLQHFWEQLHRYPQLERGERLKMLRQFHHELKMLYAIQVNDFEELLKLLIDHETENQQAMLQAKEEKRLRAAEEATPGVDKLPLDGDEGELSRMILEALQQHNKKGRPFYCGDKETLARWLCNAIKLENNKSLQFKTIKNNLSM